MKIMKQSVKNYEKSGFALSALIKIQLISNQFKACLE